MARKLLRAFHPGGRRRKPDPRPKVPCNSVGGSLTVSRHCPDFDFRGHSLMELEAQGSCSASFHE